MKLSVSILNSENKKESIKKLNKTFANYIHIDVMDGIFVENISFLIDEIKEASVISNKPLDVHLMVQDPVKYIKELKEDNIEFITFHIELEQNINRIINEIKKYNKKVGISLNPDTPVEKILPYINDIDLILIMSVVPGKGGQKFMPEVLKKAKEIKKIKSDILIEIDGGINEETSKLLNNIDIMVVGTFITKYDNYEERIKLLNL